MNRESLRRVVRAHDREPESLTLSESDSVHENPSRVGDLLDEKYELIRKVGEGGMGEVYEARHRVLGRRFAIKLLHPELVRSQRMLRRFSREALSASRIENNHVVAIADCGHLPDGAPYYVMDFLKGIDLRYLLRESGPLPVPRAARLVRQICSGLAAAHELGLVHRDLKPENIFVERRDDGQDCAKILDFGVVQTDGGNSTAKTGALIGTLRYMAPEQARGDAALDHRADLYAVGSILYECLTGQVPHPGRNPEEVLFHIMTQAPVPMRQTHLPSDLVAIVQRALSKEPDERFQSASGFAEALLPYIGLDQLPQPRSRKADRHDGTISDSYYSRSGAEPVARSARASFGLKWQPLVLVGLVVVSFLALYAADKRWLSRPTPIPGEGVSRTSAMTSTTPQDSKGAPLLGPSAVSPSPAPRDSSQPVKIQRLSALRSRSPQAPARVSEADRVDEYSQTLDSRNPYAAATPR